MYGEYVVFLFGGFLGKHLNADWKSSDRREVMRLGFSISTQRGQMIVCKRMLEYNWVDYMGKISAYGRQRRVEKWYLYCPCTDRYTGRAIVVTRAMLFYAFEEKSLRVIGISSVLFSSLPLSRWLAHPSCEGRALRQEKHDGITRKERYGLSARTSKRGGKRYSDARWVR